MESKVEIRETKTSMFLLPLLAPISKAQYKAAGLVNAYIQGEDELERKDGEKVILLLFEHQTEFNNQLRAVMSILGDAIVDEVDYEGWAVVVVKWPSMWNKEWDLFLEGAYSKFSDEAKSLHPSKPNEEEKRSKQSCSFIHSIFTKAKWLKEVVEDRLDIILSSDMELFGIPTIENETLDINKFISK